MKANLDPGCIRLQLTCRDGRVSNVLIGSSRPEVTPVLRGRTAEQAARLVPMLFSLCRQAQGRAAGLALAAALGQECAPRIDPAVQREVLREHLWRCLLDLPPLQGESAMQQEFITAAKWVVEGRRDELHNFLHSPRIAAVRGFMEQADEPQAQKSRLLPPLDTASSLTEWPRLSGEFSRHPVWHGATAETGAIARQRQKAARDKSFFSSRWLARLDELLDWAMSDDLLGAGGTVSAAPVAPGVGRSLVETARGMLMHEVVLDGTQVADYAIVAPTEWNFHPQGVLVDHLLGQDAEDIDALQQRVARMVAALDPCVPWQLEWV